MARYRLRFLHQEFDLPRGVTVIGRSLDCNLTIEDPLVSRQHARIEVDEEGGVVEDLGSRNGVRVNGISVRSPTRMRDGDRVRIGTQDFVFCRVAPAGKAHSNTTGVLRLCAKCRLPYPREMVACPNCEATEQTEEETWSGSFGAEDQAAWSVQLQVESLERALALGRIGDAERIVRQVCAQVDETLSTGDRIDGNVLAALSIQAVRTTLVSNDATWGLWVLQRYRRSETVPPGKVVEALGEAAGRHPSTFRDALNELVEHLKGNPPPQGPSPGPRGTAQLEQLERLLHSVDEAQTSLSEITGEWLEPLS